MSGFITNFYSQNWQLNSITSADKPLIGPHSKTCMLAADFREKDISEKKNLIESLKVKSFIEEQLKKNEIEINQLFYFIFLEINFDPSLTDDLKESFIKDLIKSHTDNYPELPPFFDLISSPSSDDQDYLYLQLYRKHLTKEDQTLLFQRQKKLSIWVDHQEAFFKLQTLSSRHSDEYIKDTLKDIFSEVLNSKNKALLHVILQRISDFSKLSKPIFAAVLQIESSVPENQIGNALFLMDVMLDSHRTEEDKLFFCDMISALNKDISQRLLIKIKNCQRDDPLLIKLSEIVLHLHSIISEIHEMKEGKNFELINLKCLLELYKKMKTDSGFKFAPLIYVLSYCFELDFNSIENIFALKKTKLYEVFEEYNQVKITSIFNNLEKNCLSLSPLELENIKSQIDSPHFTIYIGSKQNSKKDVYCQKFEKIKLILEICDSMSAENFNPHQKKELERLLKIFPEATPLLSKLRKEEMILQYNKRFNLSSKNQKTKKKADKSNPSKSKTPSSETPNVQINLHDQSPFNFKISLDELYLFPRLNPRYLVLLKKLINQSLKLPLNEYKDLLDDLIKVIQHFNDEDFALDYVKRGVKQKRYTQDKLALLEKKMPCIKQHLEKTLTPTPNLNADLIQHKLESFFEKTPVSSPEKIALGNDSKVNDEDFRIYSSIIRKYLGGSYLFSDHDSMIIKLKDTVQLLGFNYSLEGYTGSHGKYRLTDSSKKCTYGSATIPYHSQMSKTSLIIYFNQALIYALKVKKILEQDDLDN